jgi:hypothetical protein
MKDDNISQYRNVSTWMEGIYIENLRKMDGEKSLRLLFLCNYIIIIQSYGDKL